MRIVHTLPAAVALAALLACGQKGPDIFEPAGFGGGSVSFPSAAQIEGPWVVDYVNKTSNFYGHSNMNLIDVGWQWTMDDASQLGMSMLIGLDDEEETPNFGAAVTYAMALTY